MALQMHRSGKPPVVSRLAALWRAARHAGAPACAAIVALVVLTSAPCSADTRSELAVTSLELTPDGPVLEVTVAAKKAGVPDRRLRFLLDTGAGINVVDVSVPTEYFWEVATAPAPTTLTLTDASGRQSAIPLVYLKRLAVGGIVRDDQPAVRLDLKRTWPGVGQDEPIDGILGMSFLRGTAFVIDPAKGELRWWRTLDGRDVPLRYDPSGVPVMTASVSGSDVPFAIDTGSDHGFQAAGEPDEHEEVLEISHFVGVFGGVVEARKICVDRIVAGDKTWARIPIVLVKPGEANALVGREVLFAGPLGLDFTRDVVTFDAAERVAAAVARRPQDELSLAWDRSGAEPRLKVGPLEPAGAMARGGFVEGDEIVAVGPLAARDLSIGSVGRLVDVDRRVRWTVRREGNELRLRLAPPPPTSGARSPRGCR